VQELLDVVFSNSFSGWFHVQWFNGGGYGNVAS
jgi:hypothetical protein